eukprot:scaffold312504_cov41-Prasinocladus_malaysianus.AAC.2
MPFLQANFLQELKDLPLDEHQMDPRFYQQSAPAMSRALKTISRDTGEKAYQAWLGYYNGQLKRLRWRKEDLVAAGNEWIGLVGQPVPEMEAKTLGKMGLRGVEGIRERSKGGMGGEGRGNQGKRGGRGGRGRGG